MAMTALDGKALLQHGQSLASRYASRIGPEAAQDLGSEAVLRAVRAPAPDGRTEPWLERIFHNLLVDRWRRQKPAPLAVDDLPELSGCGTPEEAALSGERRQLVRQSLAKLPRDLRRALLSRYYGGMSAEVAAGRLGVAPATVRTRIHRSLRRLRDMLGGLRALFPPFFVDLGAKAARLALVPLVAATVVAVQFRPRPAAPADAPPMVLAIAHSRQVARVADPRSEIPSSQTDAPAAPPPDKPRARPQPKAQRTGQEPPSAAPAVKVFEFAEEEVAGSRVDSGTDLVFVPADVKYDSLIEVPTRFPAAFEKMIEDRL
jgi:RNA polymerase sigma-70 factor (ECF subfamily)